MEESTTDVRNGDTAAVMAKPVISDGENGLDGPTSAHDGLNGDHNGQSNTLKNGISEIEDSASKQSMVVESSVKAVDGDAKPMADTRPMDEAKPMDEVSADISIAGKRSSTSVRFGIC